MTENGAAHPRQTHSCPRQTHSCLIHACARSVAHCNMPGIGLALEQTHNDRLITEIHTGIQARRVGRRTGARNALTGSKPLSVRGIPSARNYWRTSLQTLKSPAVSTADREALILAHLPAVKIVARNIYRRLPAGTSLDDLISTGTLGLIEAIDSFNADLGVQLRTYAAHRIRGAILDSLRRMDWARRGDRKRAKLIDETIARLHQQNAAAPEDADVARELGVGIEEYREWLLRGQAFQLVSLDVTLQQDGLNLLDTIGDSKSSCPCRIAERDQIHSSMMRAVGRMPQVEQTVLTMYFQEEMPLRVIAKVVNLHQSRVCQLKSQAILRLRSHLSKRWPMDEGY